MNKYDKNTGNPLREEYNIVHELDRKKDALKHSSKYEKYDSFMTKELRKIISQYESDLAELRSSK